jgi:hypothetical protein
MKLATSQNLITMNQLLSALCATTPHVFGLVHEFQFDGAQHNAFEAAGDEFPVLAKALASAFPDYDFSGVERRHFRPIPAPEAARAGVSWAAESLLAASYEAAMRLWQRLETEIGPAVCNIYAYESDCADPFSQCGVLSNITYLFVNRDQMKVVMFHLREGARELDSEADEGDEDDLIEDVEDRYGYDVF